MIYIKNSHTQDDNSSVMEKLTIKIPTTNSQTFTICNWYLLPENSHYLQRTIITLPERQPDTKEHEVTCADIKSYDQTVSPNAEGEYLLNVAMDTNSTFLNDRSSPQDKIQQRALSLRLTVRSSMLPLKTDTIGNRLIPCHQTIDPC